MIKMRDSRILKIISYITMPMLIAALIISIMYISIEESNYFNEEKYYISEDFAIEYMNNIERASRSLIYNKDEFESVKDGNTEIFYSDYIYRYNNNADEALILIIYKDKALTNINLTSETDTIEKIKTHISQSGKTVNVINEKVESENEMVKKHGIQYFDGRMTYYKVITEPYIEEYGIENYNQYTTQLKDFEIYSSYVEKFKEDSQVTKVAQIFNEMPIINQYSCFIIPISTILIILSIMYLIISIGHKTGIDGIALNDFDKIPLEIIIFIAMIIGCIPFVILSAITHDYDAIISLFITAYVVIYTLSVIVIHTSIKRIKSKTFLRTTITGRVILFAIKCLKKCVKGVKDGIDTMFYSSNITLRVLMYVAIFGFVSMLNLAIFNDSAMVVLIELALIAVAIYKVIKALRNYSQIENKLKEMYEGNNSNELNEEEFMKVYHNIIKYLNDISNGFENAIQDRIKSEKLKAELITNVSHDIKTPLTSIINYVDLLKQENIENEKAKEYIEILDNKSQRLKKLTEDLVEASKVSTGNISLNLEKINIVELINQAEGEFEDKFKKSGLETIIYSQENEININADSRYMYRVIENLFSNIAKYALENSRIYIDIRLLNKQAVIEIKNISKERLNISAEELMQRFVRGDKSRTTEGSGLGISIAQNLTELQNGEFKLILDGDLFKVELKFDMIM